MARKVKRAGGGTHRLLQKVVTAVIRPGDEAGYVAECLEIPVVTQGRTLDEVTANLREAVALHLADEDVASLGLTRDPSIVVTLELLPAAPRSSRSWGGSASASTRNAGAMSNFGANARMEQPRA